jgi:hypothetical protein
MLNTNRVTYVRLSDVLAYMVYPELMEDAGDIFQGVTWGDSMHTIVLTEYVLNMLYYWLDGTGDQTWTDEQAKVFTEKAEQLEAVHSYVDMES